MKFCIQLIWQDGDTMYYSKGAADPDYCVVCFIVKEGHYYYLKIMLKGLFEK